MILLSFTSAAKYVIGLMLVMLGFAPYEAPESKSAVKTVTRPDSVWIEKMESRQGDVFQMVYECENAAFSFPEYSQAAGFATTDSLHIYVIKSADNASVIQCSVQ